MSSTRRRFSLAERIGRLVVLAVTAALYAFLGLSWFAMLLGCAPWELPDFWANALGVR